MCPVYAASLESSKGLGEVEEELEWGKVWRNSCVGESLWEMGRVGKENVLGKWGWEDKGRRRGGSREGSLVDQCAVMDNDVFNSEWLNTPSCFIHVATVTPWKLLCQQCEDTCTCPHAPPPSLICIVNHHIITDTVQHFIFSSRAQSAIVCAC